jgi:hypothetical protein
MSLAQSLNETPTPPNFYDALQFMQSTVFRGKPHHHRASIGMFIAVL